MPRLIQLTNLPSGVSLSHALPGETVKVQTKDFVSSEDGEKLVARLDGVSACFSEVFGPGGIPPSVVDHFLAIVGRDRKATVYCNEVQFVLIAKHKRNAVRAGDAIFKNDIADIEAVELLDAAGAAIEIPRDSGVVFILSVGWRKGVFYDYSVFREDGRLRTDNLPRLFGHFFGRLLFQELYSMTEEQWQRLTEWGWFPFVGLQDADRRKLINWALQERQPHPVFEEICRNFRATLERRVEAWKGYELLTDHIDFIQNAMQAYFREDYMSCIQVLYPRIEGVIRTLFAQENPGQDATQGEMVTNLTENQFVHSLLLPDRFTNYLKKVYFRNFDQGAGVIPLSRNSISHGVSVARDYDFVKATIGFMILDQVFYFLSD